ncbi:unnamed protein product, partial [Polarella glacialis]
AGVVDAGVPGFAREAAGSLLGSGWTLLRNALNAKQITALRLAATSAAEDLLSRDPQRRGNRGPRRYSFGGASTTHHMVHLQAWADLMDNEALRSVLELAFGGQYVAVGGGGDFVLGETDTHQRLHVDL